jgi:hypothetical protein
LRMIATLFLLPNWSTISIVSRQLTTLSGFQITSRFLDPSGNISFPSHSIATLCSGFGFFVTVTFRCSANGLRIVMILRATLVTGTSSKVTIAFPVNGRKSTTVGSLSSFRLFAFRIRVGVTLHCN